MTMLLNTPISITKVSFMITGLGVMIGASYLPSSYRLTILFLLLLLIFHQRNFKENTKKEVLAFLLVSIITINLDLFVTIILDLLTTLGQVSWSLSYLANILYLLLFFLTIHLPIVLKIWHILLSKLESSKFFRLFIKLILIFLIGTLFISQYQIASPHLFLFSSLLLLIFIIYMLKMWIAQNTYKKAYDEALRNLKDMEQLFDELQIQVHEQKNLLAIIKGMVAKNSKAAKFIETLLTTTATPNLALLKNLSPLNNSSLMGLFYNKLMNSKHQDIYTIVEIDPQINARLFKKFSPEINREIALILGVFLDNAIEATLEAPKKSLSIYIYCQNDYLIFQIANTFQQSLNISFLGQKGYTTKGTGHGHGLYLVNGIIRRNFLLKSHCEISNEIFTQYLEVKLQKGD